MSGRSRVVSRPGGAWTTAGIALTSRMAVAFRPAVLWSPVGPDELQVERVVGLSSDLDPVRALAGGLRPIRGEIVPQPGHVLEHHDGAAVQQAPHLEVQGPDGALGHDSGPDDDVLGCGQPLVPLLDLVELYAEPSRDLMHDAAPRQGEDAGLEQHRNLVHRLAKAHDVKEDHGLVVRRIVEDLGAPHLVDTLADSRQGQWEQIVGEPRVDAVHPEGHASFLRRPPNAAREIVGHPCRVLQKDGSARHDVGSGSEDSLEVLEGLHQAVVCHGGVHDTIGLEGKHLVRVGGGSDAQGSSEAGKLPGVHPDLCRIGHPDADELQLRMAVDSCDRMATDVSGGPLHDPKWRHSADLLDSLLGARSPVDPSVCPRSDRGALHAPPRAGLFGTYPGSTGGQEIFDTTQDGRHGQMGRLDKVKDKAQELKGDVKEKAGKASDDGYLESEGKADKVSGNLKQAGEKVKDAFEK